MVDDLEDRQTVVLVLRAVNQLAVAVQPLWLDLSSQQVGRLPDMVAAVAAVDHERVYLPLLVPEAVQQLLPLAFRYVLGPGGSGSFRYSWATALGM